ncbi:MAG: hypothetical protein RDV00_05130 [Clostridia bacterium]|nr:hypothetical protein [Clostridia bacterium]MDQ7791495.1 hypothetical protein [Clostridia bacterium]
MPLSDLIDEFNEIKGGAVWETRKKSLFDIEIPEVVLLEKHLNKSYFKVYRDSDFQIVFVHNGPGGERCLKVDLHKIDHHDGIRIVLGWSPDETVMKVSDVTSAPKALIINAR